MKTKTLWGSLTEKEKRKRVIFNKNFNTFFELSALKDRWFDYRLMGEAESTYLFADLYSKIYKEYYIRIVDIRTADSVVAFKPEDIYLSNDRAAMYRARAAADAIGCKYEFYIRRAFDLFLSYGHKSLPRPRHLEGEELSIDIARMWEDRCATVLQFAEDEFYTADRWVGHPDQVAYHDWLIAHVKKRDQKAMVLSDLLRKSILPKELVLAEFGQDVFNRALFY